VRRTLGKLELNGIGAVGCENITRDKLDTTEIHSYRMEAMALLDGMTVLSRLGWEGTIQWHTDSKAVIDTFKKYRRGVKASTWTKQRDKDVWEAIIKKQKGW